MTEAPFILDGARLKSPIEARSPRRFTPYNVRYQRLNSHQPSRRDYDWPLVPDRICGAFERYNSCSS